MSRIPPLRLAVRLRKGGGGATTTATNLAFAAAFEAPRDRILLVDGDPENGSIYERAERAIARGTWPHTIQVERWKPEEIPEAMAEFDAAGKHKHVIIESQNNDSALYNTLLVTDHLVMPVSPDTDDVARVVPTIQVAARAMQARPVDGRALALSILMVKVNPGPFDPDLREIRREIGTKGYPLLETSIPLLKKFRRKGDGPSSVDDISPYDEALREIIAIERSRV